LSAVVIAFLEFKEYDTDEEIEEDLIEEED